jgi:hypothetical protein
MKKHILFLIISLFITHWALADVPDNVQAIFQKNTCLNCHSGQSAAAGLDLSTAKTSERGLVNVVAGCSQSDEKLVVPGNPLISILQIKLTHPSPDCGKKMPLGSGGISQDEVKILSNWIKSLKTKSPFGVFRVEFKEKKVNEYDKDITLTIFRDGGSQGQVSIDYTLTSLSNDTASPVTDYHESSGTLVFSEGVIKHEIKLQLKNDDEQEPTETFSFRLMFPTGGSQLDKNNTMKIIIIDDDNSPNNSGTIEFDQEIYTIDENLLHLQIVLNRTLGDSGRVSVNLTSSDQTALSGDDYQAINEEVVFEDGVIYKEILITLIDDNISELLESFTLSINQAKNNVLIGKKSHAIIQINDHESVIKRGSGSAQMLLILMFFTMFRFYFKKKSIIIQNN